MNCYKKKYCLILFYNLLCFALLGQSVSFIESKTLDFPRHTFPLYDHQDNIIGTTEWIIERPNGPHTTDFISRTKIKADSGFEIEINGRYRKVIYLKNANRVIVLSKLFDGYQGCLVIDASDLYVYDEGGSLLYSKIYKDYLESKRMIITEKGEIYFLKYSSIDHAIMLTKLDGDAKLWDRKLTKTKQLSRSNNIITISPNGNKIGIFQPDGSIGKQRNILSIFNDKGELINQIIIGMQLERMTFWGNDKMIFYSNASTCLLFVDLKEKFYTLKERKYFCIQEFISLKEFEFSYFIDSNKKYFAVHSNNGNELLFFDIEDNKLKLLNRTKINPIEFNRPLNILCAENCITLFLRNRVTKIFLE